MFGLSKWCRMLALDASLWRAREKVVSSARDAEFYVPSDHRQKVSDGVTRQRQGTPFCSGRSRLSTRKSRSTPPASHVLHVDHRAFAKPVQNVFRSLRCFLDKSTCPHVDVGAKNAHCAASLTFPASALFALLTSTCPKRRQVPCCGKHLKFAQLFFWRC